MTKQEVIDKALSFSGGGMVQEELEFLYDFCKGKTVLELGSMYGQSSYVIASVAKHLTCVDAWQDSAPFLDERQQSIYQKFPNMEKEFDENMKGFTNVKKWKGMTSTYGNYVWHIPAWDIVLIDADHSYEGCKADIALFRFNFKESILFHDYDTPSWPGVKQAVDESGLQVIQQCEYLAVTQ